MMIAARTVAIALGMIVLVGVTACSREQRDWRAAQAADTIEAYDQFIARHPDSERITQARNRLEQLAEERDWKRATDADNPAAYREFLVQHPNGRWAQEARIRIESFALAQSEAAQTSTAAAAETNRPEPQPSSASSAPSTRTASSGNRNGSAPASQPTSSGSQGGSASAAQPASAPRRSGYGIQLGAFSSNDRATQEWQRLSARFSTELKGLSPRVQTVTSGSGRLYRLQADVESEARARAICDALKRQSQGCVVVLP